jgi:outer membrane protein
MGRWLAPEAMCGLRRLCPRPATARYKIGLSGIVQISRAQLNETQAEIANTNARYSYQTALAQVRYEVGQ